MFRQDLEKFLSSNGWTKDSYGHFKKGSYRVKMGKTSVRYEVACHHEASQYSPAKTSWVRIAGDYFNNIKAIEDGKRVVIGSKILGIKEAS